MTQRLRFPIPSPGGITGPAEPTLILDLGTYNTFAVGGPAAYVSTAAWKLAELGTESPFACFVIEFSAAAPITIGDGTINQQIGLFGCIGDLTTGDKFLLGILGCNRGGVSPQIQLVQSVAPQMIAYTQKLSDVSVYDGLAVGGAWADVDPGGEPQIQVRIRPIFKRDYLG